MNSSSISITGTGQRRLYEVTFCYLDGCHEYHERSLYRASKQQLEAEINAILADFAGDDDAARYRWTFEDQHVTAEDLIRVLEVSARVLDSLDDLDIEELR